MAPQHTRTKVLSRALLLASLGCVAAAALSGCYERVVSAHGFGADQYNVSRPYQESGAVDDWIFGPQPKANKTLLPSSRD